MRCFKCGQEIEDAAFCRWCGAAQARPIPRPSRAPQLPAPARRRFTPPPGVIPGADGLAGSAAPAARTALGPPPAPLLPVPDTRLAAAAADRAPSASDTQPTWQPPPPVAVEAQPFPPTAAPGGDSAPGVVPPTVAQPRASRLPAAATEESPTAVTAPRRPSRPGLRERLRAIPRPLLLAAAIGLPLLLGATAALLWFALSGGGPGTVPLDPHRLPPTTSAVTVGQLALADVDDPQLQASYRAALLGSALCAPDRPNPWFELRFATSLGAVARRVGDDERKQLAETLQCGAQAAERLEGDTGGRLVFEEDDKHYSVRFVGMREVFLPAKAGWLVQTFAGLPAHCYGGKSEACEERSPAALAHEGLLYWGERAAVERLARHLALPARELSTGVEALHVAASHVAGLGERALVANPSSTKELLLSFCKFGERLSAFRLTRKDCFPEGLDKRLELHDTSLRAASFDQPATLRGAERLRLSLTLVTRDAEAAERLTTGLAEFARDWRSHIANHEAQIYKTINPKAKTPADKLYKALVSAYARGMQRIEVERDGRSVHLTIDEELTEAELREGAEVEAEELEHRRVALVLQAIRAGSKPPTRELAALTEKAVDRSLERIGGEARRYFERTRDQQGISQHYRRYLRQQPLDPPAFPPATEGGWLTGEAFIAAAPWLHNSLMTDDLALYKWRFSAEGAGQAARYTLEARLDHTDGAHTTRRLTGSVDDGLAVVESEIAAVK